MPGTNLNTATSPVSPSLWIREVQPTPAGVGDVALALSASCLGTPPIIANTFAHGCFIQQLDTADGTPSLYENIGTVGLPNWALVGTSAPGTISLPNGQILIGDVTNHAVPQTVSGDITMTNSGSVTLLSQKSFTAQVTLNQAQILTLNSVPVQIIAAGGIATRVIVPLAASMAYTFDTAPFATNTTLQILHNGTLVPVLQSDISQGSSTFAFFASALTTTPAAGNDFVANAAVNLFVPTGDPTGGGAASSLKVTVLYTIMDVL